MTHSATTLAAALHVVGTAIVDPGTNRIVHRTPIQMRFADTDALGHVNNGSFVIYAESARLDFFRALGSDVKSLILARIAVDFRKQVRFNSVVTVDTWIGRVGNTSVTLHQTVNANDEPAAEVESVVVRFDYEAQKPSPWTEETSKVMARYQK